MHRYAPFVSHRLRTLRQRATQYIATLTGRAKLHVPGETIHPTFIVRGALEARKICALGFEQEPLARMLRELRSGDVLYDIGGNIGLYAVPSAMKLAALGAGAGGTIGQVVAFEPVPAWAARLRQNARRNQLTNLSVFDLALSNTSGHADFVLKPQAGSGMGSLVDGYDHHLSGERTRRIQVEVSRAEEFVKRAGVPPPTVLKIDVEGAEHAVLDGLGGLLDNSNCRFAVIEIHTRFSTNDNAVESLLAARGFRVEREQDRGSEYHVFASRS